MKFKARYLRVHEASVEADSAAHAAERIHQQILRGTDRLLEVIPVDQHWSDHEPTPRPPRNTPPGGSPGTPSLPETIALLSAVAA